MQAFFLFLPLVCIVVQALSSPILDKNVFTRYLELPNNIRDVRFLLSQGDTWVPVIGLQKSRSLFVSKRRSLFAAGVYPGVEYKLLNITVLNPSAATASSGRTELMTLQGLLGREFRNRDVTTTTSSSTSPVDQPVGQFFDQVLNSVVDSNSASTTTPPSAPVGQFFDRFYPVGSSTDKGNNNDLIVISEDKESMVELTVAPAYPLIKGLEREWPVRIALSGNSPGSYLPLLVTSFPLFVTSHPLVVPIPPHYITPL